ncbi:hypothetical protein A2801_03230 [Candidatus Woesebacteria bacterium RIFCSPHIGHO2_01_FULL_41_10]|uniref:Uncharacterized protein n=1 Tax=Candidatus Woesebacteria bacterium RIFCSPHIGHO2_01_FULL_41_10 TaxID=1802500 RepID=A0A1F7YSW3_9BACT|nr:MAG: hypothetical protein A2801_03230 [Candidatus Woesebacteria bacterium RIFCSPHIGHO2_01_FULL_41_10]
MRVTYSAPPEAPVSVPSSVVATGVLVAIPEAIGLFTVGLATPGIELADGVAIPGIVVLTGADGNSVTSSAAVVSTGDTGAIGTVEAIGDGDAAICGAAETSGTIGSGTTPETGLIVSATLLETAPIGAVPAGTVFILAVEVSLESKALTSFIIQLLF